MKNFQNCLSKMKRARIHFILLVATAIVLSASGGDLRLEFAPQFNGRPLAFDALKNQTASGQTISVTRLDFLLSDIALRRADGIWIEQKNWFGCIGARDGKTQFHCWRIFRQEITTAVRFLIGLEHATKSITATQRIMKPARHPLNPDVNHLYWGWSHEYVFLALEGGWQNGGSESGFSYHIATDRELMTVELPVTLDLNSSREIQIALDVGKIFSAPNQIALSNANDTTHSRTNDLLAAQLRQNVKNAFAVENVKEFSPVAELLRGTNHIEIAPNATPYRLTISQFAPQPDLPRDNPLTGEGVIARQQIVF